MMHYLQESLFMLFSLWLDWWKVFFMHIFSEMLKEKIFFQIDYIFLINILFRYSVPIYSYLPIYSFIYYTSKLIFFYILAIIWMQEYSAVKNTIISAIKVQIEVGCNLQIHNKNVMKQQILWNWVLHG